MFHINQIETTFGKVFDFGFDKWWFQLGKSRNTTNSSLFLLIHDLTLIILPHCQSNPQGVDFLCTYLYHTHENYTSFMPSFWWGEFLVKLHDVPPKARRGFGFGGVWWPTGDRLVEVMAGCWPCRQVAVVPILSPRYHGSFCMKSFADIRIGYRYEFFRYHCIAICWVFSTQSSSGWFFKQIIMFLWYIRDSYEFWWD